jgi:hypothetical protein
VSVWRGQVWPAGLDAWDADDLGWNVVEALAELKFRPDLINAFTRDTEMPLAT